MSEKTKEFEKKVITPHLLVNTPFAEYCDGNRLQIAASQARQALPLLHSEPAYVITGYERDRSIPDRVLAKGSGEVKFVSSKAIVIYYKDLDEYDVIPVLPEDEVHVQEGQYVVEGDLIKAKEYFFTSTGELTQGVNLVCAIISHPLSFEDAFVVSDKAKKALTAFKYEKEEIEIKSDEVLLSIAKKGYKPIPDEGEMLHGKTPLYIKSTTSLLNQLKPKEVLTDKQSVVKQVFVVLNHKFDSNQREFYLNLKYRVEQIRDKILTSDLPDIIKTRLINIHLAFDQSAPIEGFGKQNAYIKIYLRKKLQLQRGDKLTNRHAAKGVLGKTFEKPENEMPVLSDGRVAEIIINPMAIPSRMNTSQLFEIAANRALYNFKQRLAELIEEGKSLDELYDFIYKFYGMMAEKASWILEGVKEQLEELKEIIEPEDLLEIDWRFIAPAFESVSPETLQEMLYMVSKPLYAIEGFHTLISDDNRVYIDEENVEPTDEVIQRIKEVYGRFIPEEEIDKVLETNPNIVKINPFVDLLWYKGKFILASADYMYFYRLVHISDEKLTARSMSTYDMLGQPSPVEKRKTPHKFGEMEVWDLIAYDALKILDEFLNTKSDNHARKLEYIYKVLTGKDIILSKDRFDQESIKVLRTFLYQLGIRVEDVEPYFNVDYIVNQLKGVSNEQ